MTSKALNYVVVSMSL